MTTTRTPRPSTSRAPQRRGRATASTVARRALRLAASIGLAVTVLGGLAFAGSQVTAAQSRLPYTTSHAASAVTAIAPPSGDLVVAVVLGSTATIATDAMGPFEVFGRSPHFAVYTVADKAGPAPVEGAPAILPDHTFAEVDADPGLTPDVVVVPGVADPSGEAEQPTRDWIVRQSEQGAHVLSVCTGAMLVAPTGLLDGRSATSHWSRLSALRAAHPETRWVAGERYVRDGTITTTAGITSGIPGALSVVEDLTDAAEARRIGRQVGYPGWSPDGSTRIRCIPGALRTGPS